MDQNINTTLENRKSLKEKILMREQEKKAQHATKDFHFLSANLSRFMPHIPLEEHWDIYVNVLYTMRLRDFDLHYLLSLTDELSNDSEKTIMDPKIYITCHLGFCKASISLLMLKGISKIALVVDNNTYEKQAETIYAINNRFREMFNLQNEFKIVNVEKSNTVVEMMQLIKQGFSLFAYIDGNSGYKGVYNKEKTIDIPFLDSTIASRTGLSAISYFTRTPIVPLVSFYDDKDYPVTNFLEEIKPNGENIRTYMANTTKQLYKIFEGYISEHYDQWESWFYFHKYLDANTLMSKNESFDLDDITTNDFESNRFGVFKIDGDSYLFNKEAYKIYPITNNQFDHLNQLAS